MNEQPVARLLRLMATLRDPEAGCPWDAAQTFASIAPYTIEEAYEVADAIARGDVDDLREELGDLLLQVVFHARMAEEAGHFAFADVAEAIAAKVVRRHPHVFRADGTPLPPDAPRSGPAAVAASWDRIKAAERARGSGAQRPRAGVARALPPHAPAEKIARRAAAHGFDWPDAAAVVAKVREEVDEVEEALHSGDPGAVAEEVGDLLFAVANLARHARVDPEAALRGGVAKFERRFAAMADRLAAEGRTLAGSDLPAMEAAWQAVKRDESLE